VRPAVKNVRFLALREAKVVRTFDPGESGGAEDVFSAGRAKDHHLGFRRSLV